MRTASSPNRRCWPWRAPPVPRTRDFPARHATPPQRQSVAGKRTRAGRHMQHARAHLFQVGWLPGQGVGVLGAAPEQDQHLPHRALQGRDKAPARIRTPPPSPSPPVTTAATPAMMSAGGLGAIMGGRHGGRGGGGRAARTASARAAGWRTRTRRCGLPPWRPSAQARTRIHMRGVSGESRSGEAVGEPPRRGEPPPPR